MKADQRAETVPLEEQAGPWWYAYGGIVPKGDEWEGNVALTILGPSPFPPDKVPLTSGFMERIAVFNYEPTEQDKDDMLADIDGMGLK